MAHGPTAPEAVPDKHVPAGGLTSNGHDMTGTVPEGVPDKTGGLTSSGRGMTGAEA